MDPQNLQNLPQELLLAVARIVGADDLWGVVRIRPLKCLPTPTAVLKALFRAMVERLEFDWNANLPDGVVFDSNVQIPFTVESLARVVISENNRVIALGYARNGLGEWLPNQELYRNSPDLRLRLLDLMETMFSVLTDGDEGDFYYQDLRDYHQEEAGNDSWNPCLPLGALKVRVLQEASEVVCTGNILQEPLNDPRWG